MGCGSSSPVSEAVTRGQALAEQHQSDKQNGAKDKMENHGPEDRGAWTVQNSLFELKESPKPGKGDTKQKAHGKKHTKSHPHEEPSGRNRTAAEEAAYREARPLVRQDTQKLVQEYLDQHKHHDFVTNGQKVEGKRGNAVAARANHPHIAGSSQVAGVRPSPAITSAQAKYARPGSPPKSFDDVKREMKERLQQNPVKERPKKCASSHCHFEAHPVPTDANGDGKYCCKACLKASGFAGAHGGACKMKPWVPAKHRAGDEDNVKYAHVHHHAHLPTHHDDIHHHSHHHSHHHGHHKHDVHHKWERTRSHH